MCAPGGISWFRYNRQEMKPSARRRAISRHVNYRDTAYPIQGLQSVRLKHQEDR
jgi:hypothetical protein